MNTLAEPAAFQIETALADTEEIGRYAEAVAAHARRELVDPHEVRVRHPRDLDLTDGRVRPERSRGARTERREKRTRRAGAAC